MVLPGDLGMMGTRRPELGGLWVSGSGRMPCSLDARHKWAEHHLPSVSGFLVWKDPFCLHPLWNPCSKQYFWHPLCSWWEKCRKTFKSKCVWAFCVYTQASWGLGKGWLTGLSSSLGYGKLVVKAMKRVVSIALVPVLESKVRACKLQ